MERTRLIGWFPPHGAARGTELSYSFPDRGKWTLLRPPNPEPHEAPVPITELGRRFDHTGPIIMTIARHEADRPVTFGIVELLTSRLVLRPVGRSDYSVIARVNTDPELMRHIHTGVPHQHDECSADLERGIAAWRDDGFGPFVTELLDGTVVGTVGFGRPAWCPEAMPGPDIGWTVLQAHQHHGYATEAAAASIAWFFRSGLGTRLIGIHNTDNPASGAVMRRLGMRWLRQTIHPQCRYPVELWETTAPEWRAREATARPHAPSPGRPPGASIPR